MSFADEPAPSPGALKPARARTDDPPPPAPAADLAIRVTAVVENWKRKLLDLTRRNRALNFRPNKVSTLTIDFDQTAPQVHIELPINGKPWGTDIDVKGSVLPGWSAVVNGAPIQLDKTRRFIARVGAPSGNALAIKLSHPQRGVHYYLRRQK